MVPRFAMVSLGAPRGRHPYALGLACLLACTGPTQGMVRSIGTPGQAPSRSIGLSSVQAATGRRVALVIGNGRYQRGPLRNPGNDARAIAGSLRRLGFEKVIEGFDMSQKGMNRAVAAFGRELENASVGLFYYSGHGMQVSGRNYMIPVEFNGQSEAEVQSDAVDINRVLARMETAKADVNLVILDACRDNPYARSWRSQKHGLASMDAPSGTLIAYATAPGQIAEDGSGANGTYTAALLEYIETPGLPVERLFKRVRRAVRTRTSGQQIPWETTSLEGDLYFKPGKALVQQTARVSVQQPSKTRPRPSPQGSAVRPTATAKRLSPTASTGQSASKAEAASTRASQAADRAEAGASKAEAIFQKHMRAEAAFGRMVYESGHVERLQRSGCFSASEEDFAEGRRYSERAGQAASRAEAAATRASQAADRAEAAASKAKAVFQKHMRSGAGQLLDREEACFWPFTTKVEASRFQEQVQAAEGAASRAEAAATRASHAADRAEAAALVTEEIFRDHTRLRDRT